MADIDSIKPPGPVWPQPSVDKIKPKEDRSDQQRRNQQNTPSHKDNDKDGSGVDEYV